MLDLHSATGFVGPVQPSLDDLARCVHCGLCLNACPTYRATGLETESPRGRIYLMRAVKEGRIDLGGNTPAHFDLCLVCRSCETACPSGVRFGRMMEATRAQMWQQRSLPWTRRLALSAFLRYMLPSPTRFRMAFRLAQLYERSGMRGLMRRSGLLRIGDMEARERLLPELSAPFLRAPRHAPPRVRGTPRVGILLGCVMSIAFRGVHEATIRVLERRGCQVVLPPGAWCCGALNVHAGEREVAKRMALNLMDHFDRCAVDVVVVNSAGCGATMKEYHELFADEPAMLPRIQAFEAKVRDVSEYVATLPAQQRITNGRARPPIRAVYQDACHLRHAQRIVGQPRALLASVPRLQLVELKHPDLCCGSAGIYNILHPDLATDILKEKMSDLLGARPDLIISGNPGCIMQIRAGLRDAGLSIPVKHVMEVLDEMGAGAE